MTLISLGRVPHSSLLFGPSTSTNPDTTPPQAAYPLPREIYTPPLKEE